MITVPLMEMLITNTDNRPMRPSEPRFLVVHWTANRKKGADAPAHARYFNTTTQHVSAHYVVDDRQIVRCIPEDEVAYSVGAKRYSQWARANMGSVPNGKVISIEMCVNVDGKFWSMYSNTAHLAAEILNGRGWGIDRLIRHFDVTGKICPAFFVEDITARQYTGRTAQEAWSNFKKDVERLMGESRL